MAPQELLKNVQESSIIESKPSNPLLLKIQPGEPLSVELDSKIQKLIINDRPLELPISPKNPPPKLVTWFLINLVLKIFQRSDLSASTKYIPPPLFALFSSNEHESMSFGRSIQDAPNHAIPPPFAKHRLFSNLHWLIRGAIEPMPSPFTAKPPPKLRAVLNWKTQFRTSE